MKLAKNFTMPEEAPIVPQRLAERITNLLPHATKIDVMESAQGGWRVVNTIYLETGDEASEVYTMVKAAADHRAMEVDRPGKYRAQVWQLLPGKQELDRHVVTFHVHDPFGDEEHDETSGPDVLARREQNAGWVELSEQKQQFVEFLARYNRYVLDRMVEMSRSSEERLQPMSGVMTECIGMYREGLRMKSDSVREISELRMQQQIEQARNDDSGKMMEMFAPAIQVAATQFQQRFMGGGAARRRALPPHTAAAPPPHPSPPAVSRVVHTPPTPAAGPSSTATPPTTVTSPVDPPATLHELASAMLAGLGADRLLKLMRMLDDQQAAYLEAVASARDDDASAEAITGLMHSLFANPSAVAGMQQLLDPDQLAALQQVAVLAQRHLEERDARCGTETSEAATPGQGAAASAEKGPEGT